MQFAADAGLPIEAVNSAADFFVRRVDGWRDQLVEWHQGSRSTIYRPTATLFLVLKVARLSQTDLEDCLALVEHCRRTAEPIDAARVMRALDALAVTNDAAVTARRQRLRTALGSGSP